MSDATQSGLGDALFGSPLGEDRRLQPGDLIPPIRASDPVLENGDDTGIPDQEEFYRSPARFGSVPVDQAPLGWDRRQKFNKLYPFVSLPTQVVDRVSFGKSSLEPNRLFWGDNLHVMRQLPSESIDLIYIDPPFFSGRNYNVIFGDQNELRSFTDMWDGGMPGYLEWLNARLFEIKRLLSAKGTLYFHCDYHASHYIKIELDKIFGHEQFRNEVVWLRSLPHNDPRKFGATHDTILVYAKGLSPTFNQQFTGHSDTYKRSHYSQRDASGRNFQLTSLAASGPGPARRSGDQLINPPSGNHWRWTQERIDEAWAAGSIVMTSGGKPRYKRYLDEQKGSALQSVWSDVPAVNSQAAERIGYPTQKPEALLERIIKASSDSGDVVADFFIGGGTTAVVAQRLGRRWIGCDQSRVAVAVTADRLARQAEQRSLAADEVPDFTIEHWGTYEAARLSVAPPDQFRQFIIDAAQLRAEPPESSVHAFKAQLPVWIGPPDRSYRVSPQDVVTFANAVRRLESFRQGALREARMIAWAFSPAAQQQAAAIANEKHSSQNYLDIDLVPIESDGFREHIIRLSSDKADYSTFLTFVRPPEIVVGKKHLGGTEWRFDVSDTLVTNAGAKLINIQWDFDYRDKLFTSSLSYKELRNSNGSPKLVVDWSFKGPGQYHIACKVQDDMGGEGFYTETMMVGG